jgi:hypothetical protein
LFSPQVFILFSNSIWFIVEDLIPVEKFINLIFLADCRHIDAAIIVTYGFEGLIHLGVAQSSLGKYCFGYNLVGTFATAKAYKVT